MKKTISLIISIFIGVGLMAQMSNISPKIVAEKGIIKGIVKENTNQATVEYANIKVFALPDSSLVTGTITNATGTFEIKDIPYGKYYLETEFIGYKKSQIAEFEISQQQKVFDCGEIILEPSAVQLDEAVVTAEKNLVQYQIDKKVVNIDKKLTASGGNLVDALENTPSVQVNSDGDLTLRGSTNFTVLIDGKPTALSGSDALKQIPASAVANVEVITNPSAKFDPDGSAGIINIIMKKEYKNGTNGIVNASVGSHFQSNGDFNLNFRREKVNFFIGGNYANRIRKPKTEILNITTKEDTVETHLQKANREQINKPWSIKAGMDLYLSANSTLTLSGNYGFWGYNMKMPSLTKESSNYEPDLFYIEYADLDIGGNYIDANLSFEQKFNDKGHQLLLGLTYSKWDGSTDGENEIVKTDNLWLNPYSPFKYRTIQKDYENEIRAKADYTYPINEKTTLEAGYQGRFRNIDSDYGFETYLYESGTWNKEPLSSRAMGFEQNIHSLYFTVSGKVLGIDAKAGLRTEFSNRLLTIDETDDRYSLDLVDFFPTLHLSKKFNEKQELQASYSRRVNRPDEWNLYPFSVFSTNRTNQVGNPYLKPEYVDSYELNFMQNLKMGFASMEAYYKQTNNAIEQTFLEMSDDKIEISADNLDKNFSYGIELSGNFNLAKWFSLYTSANLYSYNVKRQMGDTYLKENSFNSDFVLNANFNLSKSTRLQLTGFYNAPKVTSQGDESEMYGINAALRQEFMKKKLVATLRVNDVFNTMIYSFKTKYPNNDLNFTFDMDSPTVMLNLSFTINNYKKRADNNEDLEKGPGIL